MIALSMICLAESLASPAEPRCSAAYACPTCPAGPAAGGRTGAVQREEGPGPCLRPGAAHDQGGLLAQHAALEGGPLQCRDAVHSQFAASCPGCCGLAQRVAAPAPFYVLALEQMRQAGLAVEDRHLPIGDVVWIARSRWARGTTLQPVQALLALSMPNHRRNPWEEYIPFRVIGNRHG